MQSRAQLVGVLETKVTTLPRKTARRYRQSPLEYAGRCCAPLPPEPPRVGRPLVCIAWCSLVGASWLVYVGRWSGRAGGRADGGGGRTTAAAAGVQAKNKNPTQ